MTPMIVVAYDRKMQGGGVTRPVPGLGPQMVLQHVHTSLQDLRVWGL